MNEPPRLRECRIDCDRCSGASRGLDVIAPVGFGASLDIQLDGLRRLVRGVRVPLSGWQRGARRHESFAQRVAPETAPVPLDPRKRHADWLYWAFSPLVTGVLTRIATFASCDTPRSTSGMLLGGRLTGVSGRATPPHQGR
jgi:hypothetical protein